MKRKIDRKSVPFSNSDRVVSTSILWSDFQKDVVLKDFDTLFRNREIWIDRVNSLRQWEITVLAAIFGFSLTDNLKSSVSFLVLAVMVLFFFLEWLELAVVGALEDKIEEAEKVILASSSSGELWKNYSFYSHKGMSTDVWTRLKTLIKAFVNFQLVIWHGSLIIVFLTISTVISR
ncbi:MAG: hypothetical protein J0M07_05150 [Anaerolineae bacterium]|nr:hypothetical protein [Anaerolineae bacterium]